MVKKFLKITGAVLLMYAVYFFISAVVIFMQDYETPNETISEAIQVEEFYNEAIGPDRVALIEEGEDALATRLNLIENANETIKIANFKISPGEITDTYFGLLLEEARKGTQVQFLTDGISHNLYGPTNDLYWAIVTSPNIEIRFYEPLNIFKPWTMNNRLHDKLFIVDEEIALTSGRNIGDSAFIKEADGVFGYDRDVLIYSDSQELQGSVLPDINNYFDELWNHEYTKTTKKSSWSYFQNIGEEGVAHLDSVLAEARADEDSPINRVFNWEEISHPTNRISLINNPTVRMKKEPDVLKNIYQLMVHAESQVIAQAPYLIYNSELKKVTDLTQVEADLHFLTNSETSSPNFPALAGFFNNKKNITEVAEQVYGFQGDGLLHGKSYVIDNRISLVGSFNFDPRSAFLSTENMVVIDSEPFAAALEENIVDLMAESRVYNEEATYLSRSIESPNSNPWYRDLLIIIARVLLYPFDNLL